MKGINTQPKEEYFYAEGRTLRKEKTDPQGKTPVWLKGGNSGGKKRIVRGAREPQRKVRNWKEKKKVGPRGRLFQRNACRILKRGGKPNTTIQDEGGRGKKKKNESGQPGTSTEGKAGLE